MNDCIFCKIIDKKVPAKIIFENELMVIFYDINPKADVHLLLVPKKHIDSMFEIEDKHEHLIGQLMIQANKTAKEFNFDGYKLVTHVGERGGQEVFHLHIHMLGYNKLN